MQTMMMTMMTMSNIEKGLKIAIETINEFPDETFFEVRTAVCLHNLEFWWNLEDTEKRKIGEDFKEMVLANKLKNVEWLEKYSDKHNWYKKVVKYK